ncbi:MAG: hypothetical protein ACR2RV_08480 [Verrucomicrobiales bacterium]
MPGSAADEERRVRWRALRICVCLGLLFGMVLSWPLWLSGGRKFPVLPCFGLGELPAPFDWCLFAAALCLCGAAMLRVWDRWVIVALVAVLLLLGALDQMRWQPWAYQYLLCLAPMALVAGRDDRDGLRASLDIVRLIVIAIYTWGGVHKFGVQFQRTYESDVVVGLLGATRGWLHDLILWSGHLVPWTEILIGILLLLPRVRIAGVLIALAMHAFILLTLGPFGLGNNSVVWPWNLAMAGMVVSLFYRFDGLALTEIFAAKRLRPVAIAIGVLVILMPARSYSKRWDQYLSFHLYSGHHQRMALMVSGATAAKMEPYYTRMMKPAQTAPGAEPTHQELPIAGWAMYDLNVPMPSEDRMLLRVAKILVDRFELSVADYFYRDYPELLEERGFDVYPPAQIRRMSGFPPFRQGGQKVSR